MIDPVKAPLRLWSSGGRAGAGWLRGLAAYAAGAPGGGAVVGYGQHIPERGDVATGGIVKLQDLQRAFAAAAYRYNVLYLVSSRLPDGAVAQARWAKRKGARVILNQNGVAYPAWHGDGWERVNAPMAQLLELADHVCYQSAFCKLSADRFAAARSGPSEILFNAVDTARFSPAPTQAPRRGLTLLLGGSQDAWYRVDTALQVLALLVGRAIDARLLITGRLRWTAPEGPAEQAHDRARRLGVAERVTFLGPYAQTDAPDIFRRADLLLHTKYNDPCPAVVIEAMASGLPVVYSRSGGVPELVGPAAGVGVDAPLDWERDLPPDPAAMADAVGTVADRLGPFADAARQRAVDTLDIAFWLARHRAVFEAVA